jgi:hypothetical protein
MKHHRLFGYLSLLVCVSLSCNIVKGAPPVEVLPPDLQIVEDQPPAATEPPVVQPPAQPPVDQPAAATEAPVEQPEQAEPAGQWQSVEIKNPGFEDGFSPWSELPAALAYGGQSEDENVVSRSGSHSRKLFLRYGGSYILQRIPVNPPLPANSSTTLHVWLEMPYAGEKTNKCFSLELVVGNGAGQQKASSEDLYDASPNWTALSVTIENPGFPITWIEIHAMTNKGDGSYRSFDKPVYLDDFLLEVFSPQP